MNPFHGHTCALAFVYWQMYACSYVCVNVCVQVCVNVCPASSLNFIQFTARGHKNWHKMSFLCCTEREGERAKK